MTQTRYTDQESRAIDCKTARFLPRLRMRASCQRERSELRVKTEVTGRLDTKSFRYKFTQLSCKQFHVLDLSSSRNDQYRNDRFPKRRVRLRRDAKNTFFSLSLSCHIRKKKTQEKKKRLFCTLSYDQLTASRHTSRKLFPAYDIVKNGKRCFEIWSKII